MVIQRRLESGFARSKVDCRMSACDRTAHCTQMAPPVLLLLLPVKSDCLVLKAAWGLWRLDDVTAGGVWFE